MGFLGLAAFLAGALPAVSLGESPDGVEQQVETRISVLKKGEWNDRIQSVHELAYMQTMGLRGLAVAAQDGDWQVRMTVVHALGPMGTPAVPILKAILKSEPCPVVKLMALHNLGSLVPEEEQQKIMRWIFAASNTEVNACQDQAGPGRAAWISGEAKLPAEPEPAPKPIVESAPKPVVKPARDFAPPTPEQRYAELDALLFAPLSGAQETFPADRQRHRQVRVEEVDLSVSTAPRIMARAGLAHPPSFGAKQDLDRPRTLPPRQARAVLAPAVVMDDAGGKAAYDPLPSLIASLSKGSAEARARAADELGYLGGRAVPAVPALMKSLKDSDSRVRSSACLALGNIGADSDSVVPLLVKALKDKNSDVGFAAAVALSRIETPQALRAFNRHVDKEARRIIESSRR